MLDNLRIRIMLTLLDWAAGIAPKKESLGLAKALLPFYYEQLGPENRKKAREYAADSKVPLDF